MSFSFYIIFSIFFVNVSTNKCGGVIKEERQVDGAIISPQLSPSNKMNCEWLIETDESHTISLSWSQFDLMNASSNSKQCLHSYVQLIWTDRSGIMHPSMRMCGSDLPKSIRSLQQHVKVVLVSERNDRLYKGFTLKYHIISEENVGPSDECYEETSGSLSGTITSPGWPHYFYPNITCQWLIRVQPHHIILLQPLYVHLNSAFEECDKVHLLIMDGYRFNSSYQSTTQVTRFCGPQSNYGDDNTSSYLSNSNRLLIIFRSDDRIIMNGERFGFKLSWTAIDSISDNDNCPSVKCASPICIESQQGMCSNRATLCINSSLSCDGNADCPFSDFSDEKGCAWREMTFITIICSSLISCILLIVMCTEKHRRTTKAMNIASSSYR